MVKCLFYFKGCDLTYRIHWNAIKKGGGNRCSLISYYNEIVYGISTVSSNGNETKIIIDVIKK